MLIRQAIESDLERVIPFILRDPIGWVDSDTCKRYLASGSYSTNRIWVAEDNSRHVVACAVWYGRPADHHPLVLDCLYVDAHRDDRVLMGAAMVRAAQAAQSGARFSEYQLLLKPGWQRDAAACAEIEWRRAATHSAGLTDELERLRYEWTRDSGLQQSRKRLLFSPEPEDNVFLDAFQRVAVGSLDRETRDGVAKLGVEGQARETLSCYRGMRGDRDWWRMAYTADGNLVGFTIPSANEDGHVIGYLGVVPELRGRGYGGDLLVEATRILMAAGAERVRADTDTTNPPMAGTFERSRYRCFGTRLIFSAPVT
jgi:ribosomal protein S18 acetylase RimI-like enzyme